MKKIYRSIAVTVLAALMALPMVVRAEDKIVNTIYVTKPDVSALNRLYVGQSKEDVLKEINKEIQDGKLKFQGGFPNSIEKVDLKVTEVRLKADKGGKEPTEVWPFKKDGNNYVLDNNALAISLQLSFNFVESDKGYEFAKTVDMSIKDSVNRTPLRNVDPSGDGRDGSTYFTFKDIPIFRKVMLADFDQGTKIKFKNVNTLGEPNLGELVIPLEVSGKVTLGSLLKKSGETKDQVQVEYKLQAGVVNDLWYCRRGVNQDIFVDPNSINVMTYNLNPMKKSDASTILFLAKGLADDEKMPHVEATDVTVNADQNLKLNDLIDKAITMATPDVLGAPQTKDVKKVKAFLNGAELTQNDIDNARANGKKSLEIEYRYQPGGPDAGVYTFKAKLFIEPAAAPNPPAPVPQPEQKQQAKTGNTYFDLGRNFLPTCPDSKCAKAGTNAKKDDVPNTAAAANN